MENIILIVHIILAFAIIGLVLIQRGSGGGLGIGGDGGAGGFATPRSAANILTKATTWCAIAFFATSLSLAIIASHGSKSNVVKELEAAAPSVPTATTEIPAPSAAPIAPSDKTPEAPTTP